jgi:hypothetical protein
VAVYCGTGASHSSGRIPYWLAHVRGGEGGCAKYKAKKHFTSCGLSFNKNQWAVDLEQLDFKTEDKQHRQQYTRMESIQTVRPQNLLPVVFKECHSSTNYVYINARTHGELLDACKWVM